MKKFFKSLRNEFFNTISFKSLKLEDEYKSYQNKKFIKLLQIFFAYAILYNFILLMYIIFRK